MKSKQLEHILEIGKNIPRALFEVGLGASTFLGTATGIGAGIAYLFGHSDIARNISLVGFCAGGFGFIGSSIYGALNAHGGEFGCVEEGDYAIGNIINEVKEYRNKKRYFHTKIKFKKSGFSLSTPRI